MREDGAMQVRSAHRRRPGRERLKTLLALLLAAGLAAACTSNATPKPTHTDLPGSAVPASTFANAVTRGISTLSTAHLQLRTWLSGQLLTGSGDVRFAHGAVQAADVTQQLPAGIGSVDVVVAGGTTYAKLPPTLRSGKKP